MNSKNLPIWRRERMNAIREKIMDIFFDMPKEPDIKKTGAIELKPIAKALRFSEIAKAAKLNIEERSKKSGVVKKGLTDPGLSKILKELAKDGMLEKVYELHKKPKWKPTKDAIDMRSGNIRHLSNVMFDMQKAQAEYVHGGDFIGYYKFGLSNDLMIDNRNTRSFLPDGILADIEAYAFERIAKNFRENKITTRGLIEGKAILAVEINWYDFLRTLMSVQSFINDINSGKDIFLDSIIDFDRERIDIPKSEKINDKAQIEGLKLYRLDFLIRFAPLFAVEGFEKKLKAFLKKFSNSHTFYEITQIDSKLLDRLVEQIETGKGGGILTDKKLTAMLLPATENSVIDIFDRYVKAARILRYGDRDFIKKLDEFELQKFEKRKTMVQELVDRRDANAKLVSK